VSKAKVERNKKVFATEVTRLERAGFEVTQLLASQQLRATRDGVLYHLSPTAGKWQIKGGKKHSGGCVALIAHHMAAKKARGELSRKAIDLTLFADAGWCPRTHVGGWGVWMKGVQPNSLTAGGQIKELIPSSTEAEIRALANGLAVAKDRGFVKAGGTLMIQSDSLNALGWVHALCPKVQDRPATEGLTASKPRKNLKALASPGAVEFARLAKLLDLTVFTRHVRGHQNGPDRQWVNRECDRIAGEHMRARRRAHIEKTHQPPEEARP
jgi:ribonuclease HI